MKKTIQIKGLKFERYIPHCCIERAVKRIAKEINRDFKDEVPIFLGILDGSFMFISELMQKIDLTCQVNFVKLKSYEGTKSTNKVHRVIGLDENVYKRSVLIVEDIVDTGRTIETLFNEIQVLEPRDIRIATLLLKKDSYKKRIPVNYIGLDVPKNFVIGYGLDYDGFGRNLNDIYILP